jgi:hypothetical protein
MSENPVRKITDAEWKQQVRHPQGNTVALRDNWIELKERTAAAKKEFEESVDELIRAVGEDDLPLFCTDDDDPPRKDG